MEQIHEEYLDESILNPLLTDFYQFTMVYAYWKNNRHREESVFDMYFRKSPFQENVLYNFIVVFSFWGIR